MKQIDVNTCIEREIEDIEANGLDAGTIIFICAKTGFRCIDEDLVECGKI